MRHRVRSSRFSLTVAALVLVGLAATLGAGDTIAKPGKKDKSSDHGYLGVYMQDLSRDVRRGLDLDVKKGVLISGVVEDSPAEKAGIEDGDVIVKFDGKAVTDSDDLGELVRDAEPGAKVKIELIRDGDTKTITLSLGEQPEDFGRVWNDLDFGDFDFDMGDLGDHMRDIGHTVAMHVGGPRLGIHAHELKKGLADYFETDSGVLVLDVEDESVAKDAGILPGDVVKNVAGEDVETARDIRAALDDMEKGDTFKVTVLRKGKTKTLDATMTDQENVFVRRAPRVMRHHMSNPRVHMESTEDNIREELDQLREELKELKQELKKRGDG